jgi:PAS domain S-box-containing protein
VIHAIPDAVYVGDASGIRICNEAALEMLGFGSIAELNQNIEVLSDRLQNRFAATGQRIPPEEVPFARALNGETVVEEVLARHLGTGRDVIVRCAAAPVLREGEIMGAVAVNTDITGRKHVEERLRYQARLLENVQDAVVATDEQFVVKAWNRAAEEMYGWTAGEALERYVGELVDPELYEAQTSEARRELIETGCSRNELITRRKDGAAVYIEGVTVALRGERGQITGYLSINRDVTKRKEAEEALQEYHRRIENILESFSDAFFAVDREWRFTYINERALRRMQRAGRARPERPEPRREDFLGKNLWEEFPGLVGTVFERKYREVRRDQKTAEFEAHYAPADTWFDVHAYPSEEGLSVYFQEITERKRLEQTLLEIREGERRRIARDLHDVVLQDLAAALQAVQATLVRSREPHEELDQATDTIRRTARSLRGVIHDLRLEEGQPFVKAVEALVADLDQQSECEVGLEVENDFPQELPGEVGIGLLRIVREALANARRHSGARRVVVTLWSEGGRVGVEVLDDGRGFDPATVEGSSFGLWGMEERVRELGAMLEVRSAPGKGTRVSVKAPTKTYSS